MSIPLLCVLPDRSDSRSMLMMPARPVATDAVIFVYHRCADIELGEITHDTLGVAATGAASAALHGTLAKELGLADDGNGGLEEHGTVFERRHS